MSRTGLSIQKSVFTAAVSLVLALFTVVPVAFTQVAISAAQNPIHLGIQRFDWNSARVGNGYLNIRLDGIMVQPPSWAFQRTGTGWLDYSVINLRSRTVLLIPTRSAALGGGTDLPRAATGGISHSFAVPNGAWLTGKMLGRFAAMPASTPSTAVWKGGAGDWSIASNWNPAAVPNGNVNVEIDNGNPVASAVTLDTSVAINNLTIDADDSLSFNGGTSLTVNGGTVSNSGQMTINGGNATNTELILGANTTLSGAVTGEGTVTLNSTAANGGNAYIQGNGVTLTNKETIQGDGIIGNGSLALTNTGTINANATGISGSIETLTLNGSGGITNTGLMEATNSGVLQIENTVNNAGGNITANGSAAYVLLNGADIQGGTLNTLNGGGIYSAGNGGNAATLDGSTKGALTLSKGSTYTSGYGTTTNMLGTMNNNGNIQLNGGGATNTYLNLTGNTTLQGGGRVTLSTAAPNGGSVFIQGTGVTLTNVNNTIQGEGIIGNSNMALVNEAGGTIDANPINGSGAISTLTLNGSGGVTNAGLMEATNNGVLQIENTVNNSGGNITANGPGAYVLLNGATIEGGTLNTLNGGGIYSAGNGANAATLDGTTNGALTLSKGSTYISSFGTTTNVLGTMNNNGNIQLNGGDATNTYLVLAKSTSLQGGGTVTLSTAAPNGGSVFIQGNGVTLTNVNNTIQGAGIIGNGTMSLVNQAGGTIFANSPFQPLLINGSGSITNAGTFQVAASSAMHLTNGAFTNFAASTLTGGTYNVGGTLEIDELGSSGGEIVTNAANISLNGVSSIIIDAAGQDALSKLNTNATGSSFAITGGRNFTTAGNFTNNGTLSVGTGSDFTVHGALTNFSSSTNTLTGGTYNVGGTLALAAGSSGIVTDAANITLSGSGQITNTSNGGNALANLATVASGGSFTLAGGANFTTKGNFTNNGSLTVNNGSTFDINGALTNLNTTTNVLTGGTYVAGGTLEFAGGTNGIVTDAANLTLSGTGQIKNTSTGTSALTNLDDIASGGSFTLSNGANFTTKGGFTNSGGLTVNSGSTFDVTGALSNFNSATNTLTGGTYNVGGTMEFAGANVVTNAANLTLTGTTARILNSSNGLNGIAGFASNAASGAFSLLNGATFTTAGAFTNAGSLTVGTGSIFSVKGNYTGGGSTRDDGTFNLLSGGTLNLQSGSLLFGDGSVSGAINSSGTISPGDSATSAGILKDTGAYSQGSTGTLDIFIGGATAGTQYDQLDVTTASLNGTLSISRAAGFTPAIGSKFTIMNYLADSGSFGTVNGLAINGSEHFALNCGSTACVLTVVAGALPSRPAQGSTKPSNFSHWITFRGQPAAPSNLAHWSAFRGQPSGPSNFAHWTTFQGQLTGPSNFSHWTTFKGSPDMRRRLETNADRAEEFSPSRLREMPAGFNMSQTWGELPSRPTSPVASLAATSPALGSIPILRGARLMGTPQLRLPVSPEFSGFQRRSQFSSSVTSLMAFTSAGFGNSMARLSTPAVANFGWLARHLQANRDRAIFGPEDFRKRPDFGRGAKVLNGAPRAKSIHPASSAPRAGFSGLHGRTAAAGFSLPISNLLSKPKFGFTFE